MPVKNVMILRKGATVFFRNERWVFKMDIEEKIAELRERVQKKFLEKLEENRSKKRIIVEPLYDDVFLEGVAWLDTL